MAARASGDKGERASEAFSRKYVAPLFLYRLKDMAEEIVQRPTFFDAMIMTLAFVAILFAAPFYPIAVAVVLAALLFVAALKHPFLGLAIVVLLTIPAIAYQAPTLAWLFALVITFVLVYGYMHYRTIAFAFMAVALSFSYLGYLFIIPTIALAGIILGRKRALIVALLFVFGVVGVSGMTTLHNSAYIVYSSPANVSAISAPTLSSYVPANRTYSSLSGFPEALGKSVSNLLSPAVALGSARALGYALDLYAMGPFEYIIQLGVLCAIVLMIDSYVVSSRAKYRGATAGFIAVIYPLTYLLLTTGLHLELGSQYLQFYVMVSISVFIGPFIAYALRFYGADLVKALDMRKSDTRMKFGEAFEDLQYGTSLERFSDIGNYDSTKKELKDAVLDPIEERGIARAYNLTPARGLLFFGPPGTGKTLMMRALANEVHAAFFYVKATDLLSSFAGESERKIANIFAIAKKHKPCVLFFDEIDSIGGRRENASEESREKALSQLLIELDGFQKLEKVIFVGATNVPDMLDPALLRAGRIDKVIYLPLPDENARRLIFNIYLKRYPLDKNVDIGAIAARTQRYSGADIKMVCNTVAQDVAQEAAERHKILRITQQDIMGTIAAVKPSTSLAQVEIYERFRIKFERSVHGEKAERSAEKVDLRDVVGLGGVKKSLIEAIQIPLLHPDLVEKYKVRSIKGILMFGPPGNGKTMLMKAAMTDESLKDVKMLTINGSDLAKAGIEKANTLIKDTFNTARENEPAVIFIDEIDGIAPARSSANWITSEITTELLKQMDGLEKPYGIIVVAATNRPEALDTAILRPGRFDKVIFVRPPSAKERSELFRQYLSGAPCEGIDFDELGRQSRGYTGADIADICREAKTMALEKAVKTGKEAQVANGDIDAIMANVKPSAPASALDGYLEFAARYGRK